jgi:O-6-methylguanine DNA methyltransferase
MFALFTPRGLCLLEFSTATARLDREWRDVERHAGAPAEAGADAHTCALGKQIDGYVTGRLRRFEVPLDLVGTPFQQQARQALLAIPCGGTWIYAQQAAHLGRPRATRAVAAANGQNKISILVPCHRVIGSSGRLTGYGGGVPRKQWRLALESGGVRPRDLLGEAA